MKLNQNQQTLQTCAERGTRYLHFRHDGATKCVIWEVKSWQGWTRRRLRYHVIGRLLLSRFGSRDDTWQRVALAADTRISWIAGLPDGFLEDDPNGVAVEP